MSTSKKCPFYRNSQNFTINIECCDLDKYPTICAGNIQFCENRDALRKRLSEQKSREAWNHQGEEGQKRELSTYKVLIVDDEEQMRKLIVAILSKRGHQCITASNGVEALNRIRQEKVDAVITDILMPEMDRIALTKEILSLYPYLPIMVITGHSKEYSAESAITAGARDFIEKPFSIEEFLLRFSKMMRDYEVLCQLKVKQNQMVFRLSRKSLEEINELKREIESLKCRLCSVYSGSL
jgi:CheY-like chemotaxis protein